MVNTSKQQQKLEQALKKLQEVFKTNIAIELPVIVATQEDILREAASVVLYFDNKKEFKKEICRACNREFAFAYYLTAVKCCSVECMSAHLNNLGLEWDSTAPLERRWGRYTPAIVPAVVLEVTGDTKEEEPPPKEEVTPLSPAARLRALLDKRN